MKYRIAVEDMEPNHWVAWVLDLPGCYSPAGTLEEAVAKAPENIAGYFAWISKCDAALPVPEEPAEVEIAERFRSFPCKEDPEYIINAFFEDDKRLVGYWDIVATQRLLDWSRASLLEVVSSADAREIARPIPGEVQGSIGGILRHIAGAENWYLGKLGLALDRNRMPGEPLEMLKRVRLHVKGQFWKLVGEARTVTSQDELWSARKVVRRTLWHERDHTRHIERLLRDMGPARPNPGPRIGIARG
jgi:predicted RNase H-like HicB family nuclease